MNLMNNGRSADKSLFDWGGGRQNKSEVLDIEYITVSPLTLPLKNIMKVMNSGKAKV